MVWAAMMQGASSMETMVSRVAPTTSGTAPPKERRMLGVRMPPVTARILGRNSRAKMTPVRMMLCWIAVDVEPAGGEVFKRQAGSDSLA